MHTLCKVENKTCTSWLGKKLHWLSLWIINLFFFPEHEHDIHHEHSTIYAGRAQMLSYRKYSIHFSTSVCVFKSTYPVLWQLSASSLKVEYGCKQGRHLGAAGHHPIGWCEMGCQVPLPSSMLPPRFAPRVHEPRSLQLSTAGPAHGLCSLCQTHRLLAAWQCCSLGPYVWTMASSTDIPRACDPPVYQDFDCCLAIKGSLPYLWK